MKLLVHICCGPCAIYPLRKLLEGKPAPEALNQGVDVWGFFYNPNIHPYTEYRKRLEAVKTLAERMGIKVIYRDEYNLEEFLKNMVEAYGGDRSEIPSPVSIPRSVRCKYCYSSRLEATALTAKENGFDGFSSSLLYSRYQNHEMIKGIGFMLADRYGIPFYYDDFRLGWKEGIKESKEMNLYRQQYCGCMFSEKERYLNVKHLR